MKRSLIIGATTAAALLVSAPVYAALGVNALGTNALGWNTNQTSAAAQAGLNLTFEGVTLSTGETLAVK